MGDSIRYTREKFKITQEELAEKVGISVSHLSSIEEGRRCPSVENLLKIAKVFEITVSELIGEIPLGLVGLKSIPQNRVKSINKLLVSCQNLNAEQICSLSVFLNKFKK